MIIGTHFQLKGNTWFMHILDSDGNKYSIVLNDTFDKELLAELVKYQRQHQTFALLNPEE